MNEKTFGSVGPIVRVKWYDAASQMKVNVINGVKVMGAKNILNNLALTASNLYARNLFNFVNNLYDKKKKDIYINNQDEIISKTLIKKGH